MSLSLQGKLTVSVSVMKFELLSENLNFGKLVYATMNEPMTLNQHLKTVLMRLVVILTTRAF